MENRNSPKLLILLILLAILIRGFLALNTYMIGTDSTKFLWMAQDIYEGKFSEALRMIYHPFYPFIISSLNFFINNIELSAVIISIIFGSLTLIALFYLVKSTFGYEIAIITSIFYIFHPHLVDVEADIMTEGVFIFFFISTIALGWRALREGQWFMYIVTGAFAVLAYLTRIEGIILPILFTLWTIIYFIKRCVSKNKCVEIITGLLLFWVVLSLVVFPYILWIHRETGKWHFTIKGSALAVVKSIGDSSVQDNATTQDNKADTPYKKDQDIYIEKYGKMGAFFYSLLTFIKSLHWIVVPFLVIGILFLKKEAVYIGGLLYILSFAFCYFVGITYGVVFGVDISHRYFLPCLVLLLPLSAIGVKKLILWITKLTSKSANEKYQIKVRAAIIIVLIALMLPKSLSPRRYDERGFKEAGEWIREQGGSSPHILSSKEALLYYAHSKSFAPLPPKFSDLENLIKKEKVNYIVFSEKDLDKYEVGFLDRIHQSSNFKLEGIFPIDNKNIKRQVYLFSVVNKR